MLPSASDLTYFMEAAAAQNLSRAAERLGITQPSLTLAIQRLEQSVGTQLLIRSKKGVSLTHAGRQLLAHSRELLQSWESIKAEALASHDEVQGTYVVGCHPSVARYALPLFVPKLLAEHPRLELRLLHDLSRKVTDAVIRMEADIALAINPTRHPDLVIQKLADDEVTLWTSSKGKQADTLICDPDLMQTQDLLKRIKSAGIRYTRVLPSASLEVIAELTASGAGIGILPGRVAAQTSGLKPVAKAPAFKDELCLLYRTENRKVRSIQTISEAAARAFKM